MKPIPLTLHRLAPVLLLFFVAKPLTAHEHAEELLPSEAWKTEYETPGLSEEG